eukprot:1816480-Rhodomonas_salina.2
MGVTRKATGKSRGKSHGSHAESHVQGTWGACTARPPSLVPHTARPPVQLETLIPNPNLQP